MSYVIEYFCRTHIGKYRRMNQDNYCCESKYSEDETLTQGRQDGVVTNLDNKAFGIFDGMGGEEKGEVASYIAAKIISEYLFNQKPELSLLEYCQSANAKICSYMDENQVQSMGTTAAILLFHKRKVHLCNIGDSKIYRLSEGTLEQISTDHIALGLPGMKPPLSQHLGIHPEELCISPYVASGEYEDGDIYLICSDGLTDMVSEEKIRTILQESKKEEVADLLVQQALDNGGKDNITIIVFYIRKKSLFTFRRKCFNGNV